MKLSAADIKDIHLFKYYRLVRKWACKTYSIKEADLELLIYLESVNIFSIKDFKDAVYAYSWDKDRWGRWMALGRVLRKVKSPIRLSSKR